jgi:glycosyltransferase involved in cell wall biosynthesis
MNKPKVSVIVPIYGVEKYLRQCMDSLMAQTLRELEIILVDDGSKDKCPEMIDEYAVRDSRVVAIHKLNGGYGSACNAGFALASGEYVAIVEPDDYISLFMYERLYEIAEKNDCDIVKSAFYTYFDIAGKRQENKKNCWFPKVSQKKCLWEMPKGVFTIHEHPEFFYFHPSIWSCIYRRDFIERHKIKMEEIPGAGWADNLFQVQTLCSAKRVFYTEQAFYHWRLQHQDDAEDLKDLTIPFLRTRTIHQWLRDSGITDKNIWACLYKREIAYAHIVLRVAKWRLLFELKPLFMEMFNDMELKIIKTNKYITPDDRREYHSYLHSYYWNYFYYCFNRGMRILKDVLRAFRRPLIQIRIPNRFIFKSDYFRIIFLGLQIAEEGHLAFDIPSWKRIEIGGGKRRKSGVN